MFFVCVKLQDFFCIDLFKKFQQLNIRFIYNELIFFSVHKNPYTTIFILDLPHRLLSQTRTFYSRFFFVLLFNLFISYEKRKKYKKKIYAILFGI